MDGPEFSKSGSAGMGRSEGMYIRTFFQRALTNSFKTLVGPYPSKADSLALALRSPRRAAQEDVPSWSNLRLFSAAGGSELVEWDIEKGCVMVCLHEGLEG